MKNPYLLTGLHYAVMNVLYTGPRTTAQVSEILSGYTHEEVRQAIRDLWIWQMIRTRHRTGRGSIWEVV